jgi:hypothetical protein
VSHLSTVHRASGGVKGHRLHRHRTRGRNSQFSVHRVAPAATHCTRNLLLFAVLVFLAACEPVTAPTSTTSDVLPPPDPIVTTTTTPVSTTEFVPARQEVFRGALPDGLDYQVILIGSEGPWPIHIEGTFVVEIDGVKVPAAEVTYRNDGGEGSSIVNNHLLLTAGGWTIAIDFYPDVYDTLGEDAEAIVTASIDAVSKSGFPVLRLREPFSWNYDDHPPEVRYGSFVVRRFCFEFAIACNDIRSVQVVSADRLYPGFEPPVHEGATITSVDSRSVYDPFYLDPGPSDQRQSADVIWTGGEMIVWGGKQTLEGFPTLVDGSAFNPVTNTWRMLPSFPLTGPKATRAIWADDEMLVLSADGVFGYHPETDSWRTIAAEGVLPSFSPGRMLYLDGSVYVWDGKVDFHVFDVSSGQWRVFPAPDPGPAHSDDYFGVLRAVGGDVLAIVVSGGRCSGMDFWKLVGEQWEALPAPSEVSCSLANQTAAVGDSLVVWEESGHTSFGFSPTDTAWRPIPPVPLGGMEGPDGPVRMDDDRFMVPRWGEAAIFDANTESWTKVNLPGAGSDGEIVWTGTEFLAWGILGENFDAWRWTPPPG